MSHLAPWLLALGMVMSVSTQLRLSTIPVGPGELLLFAWVSVTLFERRCWPTPSARALLVVGISGSALLLSGYLFSSYPPGAVRPSPAHDSAAYLFCWLLALNYATLRNTGSELVTQRLFCAFFVSAALALLLGVMLSDTTGVNAIYGGWRWQHLSENPNQFALMVLPLPLLAIHHLRTQPNGAASLLFGTTGLLALVLGWSSRSDALAVAWVMGGGLVGLRSLKTLVGRNAVPRRPTSRNSRNAAILLGLMVFGSAWQVRPVVEELNSMSLTSVFLVGSEGNADASTASSIPAPATHATPHSLRPGHGDGSDGNDGTGTGVTASVLTSPPHKPPDADHNQGSVRSSLWYHAIAAIRRSPIVGFGPGAHSGFQGPFGGEEAHNTLLDWTTQTGVLGLLILALYLGWIFYTVAHYGNRPLTGMLLGLALFSIFHLTLRQPLFWLLPLLAVELAKAKQRLPGGQELAIRL